jgi:hypothetical protein
MEKTQDKTKQNSITNTFIEQLDLSLSTIESIMKILDIYNSNVSIKNYDMEVEFELIKLNLKFMANFLGCFLNYKQEIVESHKIKMLKLFDFTVYELRRLRKKFEEVSDVYFNIDEENKYIRNIKSLMETEELKPTKLGCLYLRLLNHYLKKINKRLKLFSEKDFFINNEEKEKFLISVKFLFY